MCPKQTPHPGLKFGKICGTKKTHEPDTRDLTGHHGNVFAGKNDRIRQQQMAYSQTWIWLKNENLHEMGC